MKAFFYSKKTLALLAVITFIVVGLIPLLGRGYRFDLTENKLFTLSQGSKNIIQKIPAPIHLTLYFSNQQTKTVPELRNYAQRVRDLLKEYTLDSDGKLTFSEIDPEPFSEAEDQANSAGLKSVPLTDGGDPIYFGLIGENAKKQKEVIPFFNPPRENFLEYDISQLIYRLSHPQLHKIGLISGLPLRGGFDVLQQKPTLPWAMLTQVEKNYQVQDLDANIQNIPDNIDLLWLVHPKQLPLTTLYAIDQFVLRGGKLMVFVDPWAELDPSDEHQSHASDDLALLFKAWGVSWSAQQVVADDQYALSVSKPSEPDKIERHLALMGIDEKGLAKNQVVTDRLETVNVATAGAVYPLKNAKTKFVTLIHSSSQAMLMPNEKFKALKEASELLKDFKPTGKPYTLVADITGSANTAFPQGVMDAAGNLILPELRTAKQPIHVVIAADTDLLSDRLWVQVDQFFDQTVAQPFASNGDLVTNLIDYMTGSDDLIQIRSRARFQRPFERVEALQLKAQQAFRKNEQMLEKHLAETEHQLAVLQPPGQTQDRLSIAQKKTLEKFQQQKLQIRKQLRDVRHELDDDIDHLGFWLKVVNILGVPVLLTLFAIGFSAWRRSRR